jgi:hypothetical protein
MGVISFSKKDDVDVSCAEYLRGGSIFMRDSATFETAAPKGAIDNRGAGGVPEGTP